MQFKWGMWHEVAGCLTRARQKILKPSQLAAGFQAPILQMSKEGSS